MPLSCFKESFTSQVTVAVFTFCFLNANQCRAGVIKDNNEVDDKPKFSPYFAAFSDQLKSEMKEYERLKRQLTAIHVIDWNVVAEIRAFESNSV